MLLAVPNASEGRDRETLDAIGAAFVSGGARLLDVHSDPHHHRSVFTLAGEPGRLHEALLEGAREAVERIDLTAHEGLHPRVGVLDVAPVVHRTDAERGAATAEALLLAHRLGRDLGLPVYLYGTLAGGRARCDPPRAWRAGQWLVNSGVANHPILRKQNYQPMSWCHDPGGETLHN